MTCFEIILSLFVNYLMGYIVISTYCLFRVEDNILRSEI